MLVLKRLVPSIFIVVAVVIFTAQILVAQARAPLPQVSTKAGVMQRIGTTDISITYSRPAVKGRMVWGEAPADKTGEATLDDARSRPAGMALVPYGHVWRSGANEATEISFADAVLINGQPLAAGKYSFHTIPAKDGEWTLIFNKDLDWGSFTYKALNDALRVKTKAEPTADSQELLTYTIDPVSDTSAKVVLRWEKLRVPFTVEVKDVVGSTMKRLEAYVAAAKSDDPGPATNAANYAKANKQAEAAAKWYDAALRASDEQIKAKANFANLGRRANILVAAGRMQEALAAAEKALEAGKAEKADTAALEKRIADLKAGKQ